MSAFLVVENEAIDLQAVTHIEVDGSMVTLATAAGWVEFDAKKEVTVISVLTEVQVSASRSLNALASIPLSYFIERITA